MAKAIKGPMLPRGVPHIVKTDASTAASIGATETHHAKNNRAHARQATSMAHVVKPKVLPNIAQKVKV